MESLFKNLKHGWGLKDTWQQSRQALMRWVTMVAAGYAINQMLAFTDPARRDSAVLQERVSGPTGGFISINGLRSVGLLFFRRQSCPRVTLSV